MFEPVPQGVNLKVVAVPAWRCLGEPEGYVREYWQNTRSRDNATTIKLSDSSPYYYGVVFTLDHGETTSGVVGSGGGEVVTNEVSLNVPSGAVASDIAFTVTDNGENYQVTTENGGKAYAVTSASIGPEGTNFTTPATLTFNWPDNNSDGIVDGTTLNENNLVLSKNGLVIAGPCKTDLTHCNTTTNTFTVQVSSLSEFVVGVINYNLFLPLLLR